MRFLPLAQLLACSISVAAMFIRHDVPDSSYLERAKAPEFGCVGRIENSGVRKGSCVLISPRWAITDAHVVQGLKATDVTGHFGSSVMSVRSTVIHPDYQSEKHKNEATGLARKGIDLALVEFDTDIAGVTPAVILVRPVKIGETITSVGFGTLGKGDVMAPVQEDDTPKRAGTNVVDAIGGDYEGKIPDWLYVTDFDGVGAESKNRCGDAKPTALECLGTGGDSGGGAFIQAGGKWQLVALFSTTRYFDVESRTAIAYGDISMYTRLDRFRDWIMVTVK